MVETWKIELLKTLQIIMGELGEISKTLKEMTELVEAIRDLHLEVALIRRVLEVERADKDPWFRVKPLPKFSKKKSLKNLKGERFCISYMFPMR